MILLKKSRKAFHGDNVSAYCLHIAEDDGEVDTDFPPLDSNEPIHKFGFSTLALVEKYSSPGLTSKESLFVRINAAHGFSLIQVDNTKVTMKEILLKAVKRRKGSQKISVMYLVSGDARLEPLILHFLSLYHSDPLSLCKKVPAMPGVWLSPLFKQLSPD
ncbi:hypothetical protein J1605_019756 [Eschrichtius robustus]|uniref:Uncharacterized protein n=1 Tax=Eschrichtius robustus TaxID=9764 RepID=A0AB34HLT1_ESCRO|nr:hypothetical protein J1605_019756 [Eschrichtius robustus]